MSSLTAPRAAGPDASSATFDRLAKHHYSALLYEACLQNRDPQKRGPPSGTCTASYTAEPITAGPSWRRTRPSARWSWSDVQLDRCREPGTFLAFALNKLRHAFQQEQRARKGSDVVLDDLADMLADGQAGALAERLLSAERHGRVVASNREAALSPAALLSITEFFGGVERSKIPLIVLASHPDMCVSCATGEWTSPGYVQLNAALSSDFPCSRC